MNAIITFLQEKGYKTVDADFYSKIDDWKDWYECNIDEFHKSSFYNGVCEVENNILQLGMAKTVCEDWANLLLNEKVDFKIDNDTCNKTVNEILKNNNFRKKANQLIETSFAFGTGAFVEFLKDGKPAIDYITADKIYPLSWQNGIITECAFGSVGVVDKEKVYYLQIHTKPNGIYIVENYRFKVKGEEIILVDVKDMVDKWETKSINPMFQIITPNIVNNYDINSPMGISVYGNAIDVLKEIDIAFDSFNNDFITGRRMVFLKSQLFGFDDKGNKKDVISRKENVLRWIGDKEDNGELVKDYSPALRADDHIKAIQFQLNLLSEKCGMGTNRYEFTSSGVKTATEVISEDSDLYANLKKHELSLETPLIDLVKAILFLNNCVECNVSVNFDDSIIEDTDSIKKQALIEYNAGLIDKVEYFVLTRKMNFNQAQKYVDKIQTRLPKPQEEPPIEE